MCSCILQRLPAAGEQVEVSGWLFEVSPDGRDFDPDELDAMAKKLMAKKALAERC